MFSRLIHLLSELRFAFQSTASLRDAFRLSWETTRFHLHNRTAKTAAIAGQSAPPFHVEFHLGDRPETVALRTFAGDLFVLYEIFLSRTYFVPESLLPINDVRIVVDCGANIGLTSIYLANRYPNARIVAVEPHPDNFALLKFNTAHQARILPIQACVVGEKSGDFFISVDRESWGNTINQTGAGVAVASSSPLKKGSDPWEGIGTKLKSRCPERVRPLFQRAARTIPDLLQMIGAGPSDQIDLLKVDIEGAEQELFAHPNFLTRTRMVIIELHGTYGLPEFQQDISPYGYQVRLPSEGMRMITAQRAI